MGGQVVFNKAVGKRNFLLVVLDTILNYLYHVKRLAKLYLIHYISCRLTALALNNLRILLLIIAHICRVLFNYLIKAVSSPGIETKCKLFLVIN